MGRKVAIIDLGTNTFQLIAAEKTTEGFRPLLRKSTPSRLGKGGINQSVITEDAQLRGIAILSDFRNDLSALDIPPTDTFVFGTSAIRNASNSLAFLEEVKSKLQLPIHVIDGDTEAQLIYLGVRGAISLGKEPHLIMDIGGGSIEFIIADENSVYWKKSFEIGAQRLIERFVKTDPISPSSLRQIHHVLDETFIPLANAIHQYHPKTLVGSSGSFETVVDIDYWQRYQDWPPVEQNGFELPIDTFKQIGERILSSTRGERMQLPGMKELRVDMIGVGVSLIHYILQTYQIRNIKVSRYSLKEGALLALMEHSEIVSNIQPPHR